MVIIDATEPFDCVVITGTLPANYRTDPDYVPLPWHRNPPHQETRLYKKCAAYCRWMEEVYEANIVKYAGVVPPKELRKIMERLLEIEAEQ